MQNYKIVKCKYWEKNHSCKFGKLCTFAHGKRDLRTRDNNILEAMKNDLYINMGKLGNNYNGTFNPYNINQNLLNFSLPLNNPNLNNNFHVDNYQNLYNDNGINNNNNNNNDDNEKKEGFEQDKNCRIFNINNGLFNFPIQ